MLSGKSLSRQPTNRTEAAALGGRVTLPPEPLNLHDSFSCRHQLPFSRSLERDCMVEKRCIPCVTSDISCFLAINFNRLIVLKQKYLAMLLKKNQTEKQNTNQEIDQLEAKNIKLALSQHILLHPMRHIWCVLL